LHRANDAYVGTLHRLGPMGPDDVTGLFIVSTGDDLALIGWYPWPQRLGAIDERHAVFGVDETAASFAVDGDGLVMKTGTALTDRFKRMPSPP
jgi:hypothetical protein